MEQEFQELVQQGEANKIVIALLRDGTTPEVVDRIHRASAPFKVSRACACERRLPSCRACKHTHVRDADNTHVPGISAAKRRLEPFLEAFRANSNLDACLVSQHLTLVSRCMLARICPDWSRWGISADISWSVSAGS